MTPPSTGSVSGSVDVDTIRRRFNFDWATSSPVEDLNTYWWWARSIRVDPNEVIADDDEGNLWTVPFTTDGADEITFGEPVRVREAYVPIAGGDGVAASALVQRRSQRVAAAALDRPTKRDPVAAAAGDDTEPTGEEGEPMTPEQLEVRRVLGLPEDATQEQVDARTALLPPVEDETATETETETATETVTEPVAASSLSAATLAELRRSGLTVVDDAALGELREGAQAGQRVSDELDAQRIQSALSTAVQDGRIYRQGHASGEYDRWRQRLTDDFAVMSSILDDQPVKVPVRERGHGGGDNNNSGADDFAAARERRFGRRQTQEA